MPQNKEVHAFDINNWKGKTATTIVSDSSSGAIEASDAPLIDRVNPVSIKLGTFAQWRDENSHDPIIIASTSIYNWTLNNQTKGIELWFTSKEPEEKEILKALKTFSDFNTGEVMIWFSPRDRTVYKEGSRIGIYQVIYVNGEKYLFFRTLCNFDYITECTRSAISLLPFSLTNENPAVLFDSEILRATPLSVKVPGDSLYGFLKNYLNFPPDFFEALSKGKDIDAKIKTTHQVSGVFTSAIIEQINRAHTYAEQIRLGTFLERELQERTGRTFKGGVCGLLYSSSNTTPLTAVLGISLSSELRSSEANSNYVHCGQPGCPHAKDGSFKKGQPVCENARRAS